MTERNSALPERVKRRDNYTCQNCGRRGGESSPTNVEAHHIVPLSQGGQDSKQNMHTLCWECHQAAHGNRHAYRRKSPSSSSTSVLDTEHGEMFIVNIIIGVPVMVVSYVALLITGFSMIISLLIAGIASVVATIWVGYKVDAIPHDDPTYRLLKGQVSTCEALMFWKRNE